MKETLEHTSTNQVKLEVVDAAWREVLGAALRRGFYGSISLELSVQDGTIQLVRRRVEQLHK